MVIALFSNTAWSIYNFRAGLIRALQADGHTVLVVVPPDKRYVALLQEIGCHVTTISIDKIGKNPLRDGALFLRFLRYLYKVKPELLVLFTIKPVIYGSIASWLVKTPSISVITGLGTAFITDNLLTRIVQFLYRVALRFSTRIFFLNEDDMRTFLSRGIIRDSQSAGTIPGEGVDLDFFRPLDKGVARADFGRVSVIPGSGVDLEKFSPSVNFHHGSLSIILFARLMRDKGVVEFVDAARMLRQHFPDVRFKLLGFIDNQNHSALTQREIENWVSEGVIEYLGSASDVRPFLREVDCVVLPSYREGIPRVLLEAAAMAIPIVTSNVPGCREVVEDGVNGFLCEPRNAYDLAQKLTLFLELSDEKRVEMGMRGREKMIRQFDEQIVIEKYRTAISSIFEQSTAT